MSTLDLPVCPICKIRESPVRQVERKEGRLLIQYECRNCGSVLVWLGDELWLNGNHWSYHKIGIADQAGLLHQSFTPAELRRLAQIEPARPIAEPKSEPSRSIRMEPLARKAPPLRHPSGWETGEPDVIPVEVIESREPLSEPPAQPQVLAPSPPGIQDPPSPIVQSLQERPRSRGSPLLVVAIGITLLCLICTAAILIADSLF